MEKTSFERIDSTSGEIILIAAQGFSEIPFEVKVSICIPAYKQIEFLRQTLESIQIQRFSNYEVVVTDDSPDDSVEKLVSEFQFDGKLTYFKNESALGSPENWNECIRRARGELIKIMHHDDHFIDADSLGDFVALLDSNAEADFAFSATKIEDVTSGYFRVHCPTELQLDDLRLYPCCLFGGNFVGAPSATIYRRTVQIEYDRQMKWLVDLDFYIRLLSVNCNFAFSSKPLIGTPTNAAHQVTEICRDNAMIELFEYKYLFSKLDKITCDRTVLIDSWVRLFQKYKIRKINGFARYGVEPPLDIEYFEQVFQKMRELSLRNIYYKLLYPLVFFHKWYPSVPLPIRRIVSSVKKFILSFRR